MEEGTSHFALSPRGSMGSGTSPSDAGQTPVSNQLYDGDDRG